VGEIEFQGIPGRISPVFGFQTSQKTIKNIQTLSSSSRKGASQFGRFFQKRHHNLADPFKAFLYFLIDFLDFFRFPSISLVKNRPSCDVFSFFSLFPIKTRFWQWKCITYSDR
jgi:hypothetical protein